MHPNTSSSDAWQLQASLTLPGGDTVHLRARQTSSGAFDEAEQHLVWQRANGPSLTYLVAQGHAAYGEARINARPDGLGVWVLARPRAGQPWRTIASLDLVTGEFHSEGVFSAPPAAEAWAHVVLQQGGLIVDEQLTWARDRQSGAQRLIDGERGLVWEWDGASWILRAGTLESSAFPAPARPYPRRPPAWVLQ